MIRITKFNIFTILSLVSIISLATFYIRIRKNICRKFGYFHQTIAESIGVTVNSSRATVSFSPKYTMDAFTGRYYTLEYGEIV